MTEAQKDTIYIDVDDEITNIIDKVKSSDHKIVALVLPKRATVLQSIVNMKLLKRSADHSKKKLVLITSEAGLLPLAGATGLHVAKNLQSKPEVPGAPEKDDIPEELVHDEELDDEPTDPDLDGDKSIGELSGEEPEEDDHKAAKAAAVGAGAALAAEDTIDMDNDEKPDAKKAGKTAKGKKDKKLKVPNFERFRKWLILGAIGLVVLLVGGYFALVRMPKATITIDTDTSNTTANLTINANTTNKTFDAASKTVPAEMASTTKTSTQTAPATGQKNLGNTATGSVTMTAKKCSGNPFIPPSDVPSGTGISANGQTYITQGGASFHGTGQDGSCFTYAAGGSVNITAQNPGAAANNGSATFTVAGRSDVSASGSASGGTDNIAKVVQQSDVEAAKAKINGSGDSDAAKTTLTGNLQKDGFMAIPSSFVAAAPNVNTSPNVGAQADSVTVTSNTTYTMLGVNQSNLNTVVDDQIKTQIDSSKQAVQDNGLGQATFTVNGTTNPTVAIQTTATIGPNVDVDGIKKEIAGKKKGETTQIISTRPSVKGVTVKFSPFWVTKTPGDPKKVTIVFHKAN